MASPESRHAEGAERAHGASPSVGVQQGSDWSEGLSAPLRKETSHDRFQRNGYNEFPATSRLIRDPGKGKLEPGAQMIPQGGKFVSLIDPNGVTLVVYEFVRAHDAEPTRILKKGFKDRVNKDRIYSRTTPVLFGVDTDLNNGNWREVFKSGMLVRKLGAVEGSPADPIRRELLDDWKSRALEIAGTGLHYTDIADHSIRSVCVAFILHPSDQGVVHDELRQALIDGEYVHPIGRGEEFVEDPKVSKSWGIELTETVFSYYRSR